MATRKELIEAVSARYRGSSLDERTKILDEFVALTGYHRKHAIRVLGAADASQRQATQRTRLYDEAVRQALVVLWEAGDRICGKRLKPLLPLLVSAMERHGHLDLDAAIKSKLLQMSAASMDRALRETRSHIDGQRKRRSGVGATIRRSVPVRTFADWGEPAPGFLEIDMVEHCGGAKTDGDFVHTMVLTDIASGWTECIAMPLRNQSLVVQALAVAATQLPVAMLGIDSDNDSAFINQSVVLAPLRPRTAPEPLACGHRLLLVLRYGGKRLPSREGGARPSLERSCGPSRRNRLSVLRVGCLS